MYLLTLHDLAAWNCVYNGGEESGCHVICLSGKERPKRCKECGMRIKVNWGRKEKDGSVVRFAMIQFAASPNPCSAPLHHPRPCVNRDGPITFPFPKSLDRWLFRLVLSRTQETDPIGGRFFQLHLFVFHLLTPFLHDLKLYLPSLSRMKSYSRSPFRHWARCNP